MQLTSIAKIPIIFLSLVLPTVGFCADTSSPIWKSTYYQAMPRDAGVSAAYCQQHEPGTFIGVVQEQLLHGAITDRHIKLNHFTFQERVKDGLYFMQGTVLAMGHSREHKWHDTIHYYVYKLTENGITQGVWSSEKCKGLYVGEIVKNDM